MIAVDVSGSCWYTLVVAVGVYGSCWYTLAVAVGVYGSCCMAGLYVERVEVIIVGPRKLPWGTPNLQ